MSIDSVSRRGVVTALAGAAAASPLLAAQRDARAPFVQTRSALEKLQDPGVKVTDTGAKGDFATDDTAALQEISDYFGKRGGRWFLPPGVYRTTAPITVDSSQPQIISGQGQRGVYPGKFDPRAETGLAVIVPVHSGRETIKFVGTVAGSGSVTIRDLAFATLEVGERPEACFGWPIADAIFLRNFNILFTSINGFGSAFDVYSSSGALRQVGLFRAMFCNIHRNAWIARTLDGTQWNGFEFSHNEAGQNGYLPGQGGIDIAAHAANITSNSFEGGRDAIRISGFYRGIDIRGNYFEANVGKALIQLSNVRGPFDIGAQTYSEIDYEALEHCVLLTDCGRGRCDVPYRANGVHKMAPQLTGASATGDLVNNARTGTDADGWLRCDSMDQGAGFANPPDCLRASISHVKVAAREISPFDGLPMPVAEYTTSGDGGIRGEHRIPVRAGEWAVMSFLMKRLHQGGEGPNPTLVIAAYGGSGGIREYPINQFDQWWRPNEWCLITAAVRVAEPASSIATTVFPFGKDPMPDMKVRFLEPFVYITDDPNKIVPHVDRAVARSVPGPPTAGTWLKGDMLHNLAPSRPGQAQFVCLETGSPGVWTYG